MTFHPAALRFDRPRLRRPALPPPGRPVGPPGGTDSSPMRDVGGSRPATPGRSRAEWAGLVALLVGTTVAYLWNLTASGYANTFYAAAVQAGTESWKAFFFGSIDSSNFITVDKPPAALWVMEISARLFGFSSASLLVPEVLAGVATVALVYAMVRRWFGGRYGLLAGLVVATTPVAALMFRFDNPDAVLVLLMTAGAYCVTRAVERGATKWLLLAGAALGFAFLAKMGQALLVVPGLAAAYLLAAPGRARRRLVQLAGAGAAMIAAAGWWVLVVTLWPAASRPMIDGSSDNSIWNLIVGYNGLSRVVSSGSGPGGSFSGATGPLRLFDTLMGGQASWLLPTAVVALVGGLVVTARRPRTDRTRAALVMWGGWLVVTAVVFSYGQGVIHTYYTVALVPAIAALVAIGAALAAQQWYRPAVRAVAAGTVALTGWWAVDLLGRTPAWNPWLRPVVAVAAVLAAIGLLAGPALSDVALRRWVGGAALAATAVATLAGPTAYTLQTVASAHTGSVPSAGPATTTGFGGGGSGGVSGGGSGGFAGGRPGGNFTGAGPGGAVGGAPTGASAGRGAPSGNGSPTGSSGPSGSGAPSGSGGPTGSGASGAGPGGDTQVSASLVKALEADASRYRWVAATDGSQSAAAIELATHGDAVMAIGGFSGTGGNLSLATFESYVNSGLIHYFIAGGGTGGGPGGRSSSSSAITAWVEAHFQARTIGATTVYDLTSPVT